MRYTPRGRPDNLANRDRRIAPSRIAPSRHRRRPALVEALEGRALLASTLYDPFFGSGGPVLGAVSTSSTTSAVAAVAEQGAGSFVTAEVDTPSGATDAAPATDPLVVRGYNFDGTIDASFGTGGATVIPLPAGSSIVTAPHNIAITPTGQILLAAEVSIATSDPVAGVSSTVDYGMVTRLTSAGALDTTFGTNGEYTLPGTASAGVNSVLVEAGGRVVVAGLAQATAATGDPSLMGVVVGVTPAGALDTTFGTDGMVPIPATSLFGSDPLGTDVSTQVVGLRFTPTGQILLGVAQNTLNPEGDYEAGNTLSRLSPGGMLDTSFGTGGTVNLTPVYKTNKLLANDMVVQPDGRIVLVGNDRYKAGVSGFVIRLGADGSVDPTFPEILAPTPSRFQFNSFQSVAVGIEGSINVLSGGVALIPSMPIGTGRVYRYLADGTPDPNFGTHGVADITPPAADVHTGMNGYYQANGPVALTDGRILVGGSIIINNSNGGPASSRTFLERIYTSNPPPTPTPTPTPRPRPQDDYDGDGKSDLAAELAQFGALAYRTLTGDTVQPFGPIGAGQAIPAPGDYDGDGRADLAAYLPALGALAYRPSAGGADVLVRFGPPGVGNAIPVPGDYDGDGRTDIALYLPGSGVFAIDPSSGAAPYAVAFGPPGMGNAIPAPGDYDGDGRTDLALYLPGSGAFAIDPSGGGAPYAVPFGAIGAGNTIPAPGDYDGDGKTDLAAYLPQYGVYAYRTSGNTGDVLTAFGPAGAGAAVPVPGDYDGDGKTDIALYLPGSGAYAIDPSGGQAPYAVPFGQPGAGNTLPATAVVVSQETGTVAASALDDGPNDAVPIYLPDPDDSPEASARAKKAKT